MRQALRREVYWLAGSRTRYELHVWAWRDNRFGTFVDWNPDVSCDEYNPK
jgi:hypothetical protein